jgi:chloride channel 2
VLISNATAALLQPSLYDSIILIKKLPYLPDLLPSSSGMKGVGGRRGGKILISDFKPMSLVTGMYNVYVEDFMVREVKYIWYGMTYKDLKVILQENKNLRSFPLVDSPESMILLGSMQRLELIRLIERQIGRERRQQVAAKWQKEAHQR